MAVSAGLRSGTGSSPMPTCSRDVQASAAAADAIPPSKNESSHSHSCAHPGVLRGLRDGAQPFGRQLWPEHDTQHLASVL